MAFHRIWAVVLRYLYATREPSRLAEFLFWPIIDIGFYGFLASWISQLSQIPHILTLFISALVLWQLIYRVNYEICFNVIDEFWEQNIFNLLASPLKISEWIAAMMLTGLIKVLFTFFFGVSIAWLFFQVNVFSIGWILWPFVGLCILSGWGIGFLAAGILIYKPRLQSLPWMVITLAALFSSIYYPLSILPDWIRLIAQMLPMAYIFEGMRIFLQTDTLPVSYLWASLNLSLFYLILSLYFFITMFHKSRQQGFMRTF